MRNLDKKQKYIFEVYEPRRQFLFYITMGLIYKKNKELNSNAFCSFILPGQIKSALTNNKKRHELYFYPH